MKRGYLLGLIIGLVGSLIVLSIGSSVAAQTSANYDLAWNTSDGGGIMFSTSADYSLGSTLGQYDAGMIASTRYTLSGGFWQAGYSVYLPLILK